MTRRSSAFRVWVLVVASALVLAGASVAVAAPKGIFAKFAQCPTRTSGVALCQYLEVTGGMFAIGRVSVPIGKTIIVQGGAVHASGLELNEYFLVPAANGESISATELEIPGGLRVLLGCSQESCGLGVPNRVTATIGWAASHAHPGILNVAAVGFGTGPALTFPVRMQLHNQLVGRECYIGGEAHPVVLRLTDGRTNPPPPNRSIAGAPGEIFEDEDPQGPYTDTNLAGATFVDNTFSVPVAQGCGERLAPLVDAMIDQGLGLESWAGRNTAILTGTFHIAETYAVLASERFPG